MARQLTPERVIGRDHLINRIWERLMTTSLRFTAERRVGKTTVMQKMQAEGREGFQVVFMELEAIDSPLRFAEQLLNNLAPLLSNADKAKGTWESFFQSIGGTEIAGVLKLPESSLDWQVTIEKTLERACTHYKDETVLLLMDEVPYMLQKIATRSGGDHQRTEALTLLDLLRSIRHKHSNLRMVYAGSIGLHHVLADLKQQALASQPYNDMPLIEIRSLERLDAEQLAERLLDEAEIKLEPATKQAVCTRVVELTDAVPFYIETVCSRLAEHGPTFDLNEVDKTVATQLTSDLDPWEMEHFRSRIDIYYSGQAFGANGEAIPNAEIARTILDDLAVEIEAMTIEQVWSACKSHFPLTDKQHVIQMLKSLALDHYLECDEDKRYAFRFSLIRRWWAKAQGLDS